MTCVSLSLLDDYGGGGYNNDNYGNTTETVTKDGFFHDTTTGNNIRHMHTCTNTRYHSY